MSNNRPKRNTGPTNELAKERNRAASERTLTAWIQNCVSLIGFGIAFDRIFVAVERAFPEGNIVLKTQLVSILSLSFIALGVLLLVLAVFQYLLEVKSIERENYLSLGSRPLNLAVTTAVVLFGFFCLLAVFMELS